MKINVRITVVFWNGKVKYRYREFLTLYSDAERQEAEAYGYFRGRIEAIQELKIKVHFILVERVKDGTGGVVEMSDK
jgi:hypothetical protein